METNGEDLYSFVGGTTSDQQQLKAFYEQLWRANDSLKDDLLRPIWTDDPDGVFFNTNGHTYYGLDDWFQIWAHYRSRLVAPTPGSSAKVRMLIRGDMAVIIDDRRSRALRWVGGDAEPDYITGYMRATVVCLRVDGAWEGVHVHFSSGKDGLRPEQAE